MKTLAIVLVPLVLFGMYGCSAYNGLVRSDETVKEKWAQVESQYQRRADLIPNLVNVVKGYTKHEEKVLTEVAEARAKVGTIQIDPTKLGDPAVLQKFEQAQGQLGAALKSLIAVSERYPDLKAEPRFADLQSQIEGTENRIAVERRNFNDVIKEYNVRVRTFPTSLIAGLTHFQTKVPFTATTPGADKAPTVQF